MATWRPFVKRGTDTVLSEISDSTFETLATEYDKTIADLTFSPELTAITWSGQALSSAPTWTAQTEN